MAMVWDISASAVAAADRHKTDAKLKQATSEFEAVLLASWLEKMHDSYALDQENQAMPGSDSMTALATQAVAQAVAARGGIGIGKLIYDRLKAQ